MKLLDKYRPQNSLTGTRWDCGFHQYQRARRHLLRDHTEGLLKPSHVQLWLIVLEGNIQRDIDHHHIGTGVDAFVCGGYKIALPMALR